MTTPANVWIVGHDATVLPAPRDVVAVDEIEITYWDSDWRGPVHRRIPHQGNADAMPFLSEAEALAYIGRVQ